MDWCFQHQHKFMAYYKLEELEEAYIN